MEPMPTQKPPGAGKSSYDLIDPGALWAALNLPQGITFLDLGCGQGNYSLAASSLIGPTGAVYAVDLWEEGLAALKARAAREGRTNLKPLAAGAGRGPYGEPAAWMWFSWPPCSMTWWRPGPRPGPDGSEPGYQGRGAARHRRIP